MPDWSAVPAGAVSGGLAGAVLGPIVTYALERFRSRESVRRARQRRLRRMLEERFAQVDRLTGLAAQVLQGQLDGEPVDVAFKQSELDSFIYIERPDEQPSAVPWAPERIEDGHLQQLARQLIDTSIDLLEALSPTPVDTEEVERLVSELYALHPRMALRMDHLNWPEVDD